MDEESLTSREWQPAITSLVQSKLDLAGAATHRSLKNTLFTKTPTRSITSREDNIKLTSPIPQDCIRENKIFERNI